MSIVGIIIIIVSIVCAFFYRSARDKARNITATETSKIQDIIEESKSMVKELGGNYNKKVEVKGTVECDSPLTSEVGKKECVYYRTVVERKWEGREHYTDSEGHSKERSVTGSDTVSSQTQSREFYVNDGTGKIRISPDGSDIDLISVVDKFEPATSMHSSGSYLEFGGFRVNIDSGLGGHHHDRKTTGYHIKEEIFPLDRRVYILGIANTSTGELRISKAVDKGDKFIISTKSEEELVSDAKKSANILKIVSLACLGIGIALTIVGLFVK